MFKRKVHSEYFDKRSHSKRETCLRIGDNKSDMKFEHCYKLYITVIKEGVLTGIQ